MELTDSTLPPSMDIASVAIRRSLKPRSIEASLSGSIVPESSALGKLLCTRRSTRVFSYDVPTEEKLQRLIVDCAGGVRLLEDEQGLSLLDRTIPQGGGINSINVDLVMLRSSGNLKTGIYRLCPCTNSLHLIKSDLNLEEVSRSLRWQGQPNFDDATALLVIHGNFETKTYKYGDRGIRFVYIEAGCALQNALLSITDQGLAGYPYGGFDDVMLTALLDLSSPNEQAIATILVGSPPRP